jgi:hypothetical protein
MFIPPLRSLSDHGDATEHFAQLVKEDANMSMINAGKSDEGRMEFNLLMCLAFAVFLVAIALTRLLPRRSRPTISGHDEGKSLWEAAKVATYNSIPFAFM